MTNSNNNVRTITLPATTRIGTPGDPNFFEIVWAELPDSVLPDILAGGAKVVMTNSYNQGGKDVPVAERVANRKARYDSWKAGEYRMIGGGPRDSIIGDMKAAYINKRVAVLTEAGMDSTKALAEAEASIKRTVEGTFGVGEKATFSRFLDAVATGKVKTDKKLDFDTVRAELEAKATEAAMKLRAERAESLEAIDIDTDNLF